MKKRTKIIAVILLSFLILAFLAPLTGYANPERSFSVRNSNGSSDDHGHILATYNGSTVTIEKNETFTFTYVSDVNSVRIDFIADPGYQLEYYVIGSGTKHFDEDPFFFDAREYIGDRCGCNDTIRLDPKWTASAAYTIHTEVSAGGRITPDQTVSRGSDCTISYGADTGYHIISVTVDGADVTSSNPESCTFINVTSDHSVSAVFEADIYDYTVTFNEGAHGSAAGPQVISGLHYGDIFPPAPEIIPEAGWTFDGWPELPALVTGDASYTATYTQKEYTVAFIAGPNGMTADPASFSGLHYGDAFPSAPGITPGPGWTFDGWPDLPEIVTDDASYTATYTQKEYTVTFVVGPNGTTADPASFSGLHYGDAFPTAPGITPDPGWTFDYWTPTLPLTVEGSAEYCAHYTRLIFTVIFKDYNGAVLSAETVEYGSGAAAPVNPDSREGYHFTGWDIDFGSITCDLTITAQYAINTYRVRFFREDGRTRIGAAQIVNWGSAARVETAPETDGKSFNGWDLTGDDPYAVTSLGNVKENIDATATYEAVFYTVIFVDFNGRELGADNVPHGGDAAPPPDPLRKGYTFKGWSPKYDNITADLTVFAVYTINTYTVTFIDYNGNIIDRQTVKWNAAAAAPDDPVREGYTFAGWDVQFEKITKDTVVTAKYEAAASVPQTPVTAIEPEPIPRTGGGIALLWWLLMIPGLIMLWLIIAARLSVTPVAEALIDNGNGTYTIQWGYDNRRSRRYRAGEDESVFSVITGKLIKSSVNPPVVFERGRVEDVFTTTVDRNAEVQWRIGNRRVKVDLKKLDT